MKIWEILKEENVGKSVVGSNKAIYKIKLGQCNDILLFKKESCICEEFSQIEIMTLNFEFIQQPVTFEEILNSDKKCRVEHNKTNSFSILENFMELDSFLCYISQYFASEDIRQIIKEGKWYLEP